MGGKLGTIFARAGHDVVFSYSRSEKKLKRLANEAGGGRRKAGGAARAGTPAEAVKDADAVLLAVHWSRLDDVLEKVGDLSGKVIVTCSLPMNDDDTGLVIGRTSSGAEELAKRLPKSRVAAAFNTLPSEVFFSVFENRGNGTAPNALYYGDDAKAKKVAARLISDVGFVPLDAGPLRIARYAEPFALLVAQLAYEGDRGPAMAYRFEWFEERNA
jgi:8-hydroxy-5-deazaflavin:NADPH oxidoreductase